MQSQSSRRERGDGSLFLRPDSKGGERWIGAWRVNGRGVMRAVGPRRSKIYPEGLTKPQADARFEQMRKTATLAPTRAARKTVEEVGEELVALRERQGRKTSTIESLRSVLNIHLVPFFGVEPVHKITRERVRRFVAELEAKGLAPKSVANALGVLHAVLDLAIREGWVTGENPVKLVEKPKLATADADIRFLDQEEVEALLRAVSDDPLGRVERVMYLAAAQTGMRQGELLALRWRDVDFRAKRIRVRRNFVRGEFGTPKSKRSSRSVPLTDRLAGELDRLFTWRGEPKPKDDDLVFAHPATGKPIDRSKLLKRFKAALKRAEVREVRFHDLRHTFGTRMAAAGVPMRTLQEWMGHRDFATTLIYSDYSPSAHEAEWVEAAFADPAPAVDEVRS